MKGRIGLLVLILIIAALLALDARAQDAPTDISPWQTQVAADTAAMTATADAPVVPVPDEPAPPPVVVVERSLLEQLLPFASIAAVTALGILSSRQGATLAGAKYNEDALNRAVQTPTQVDDAVVMLISLLQGYVVEKNDDGTYTVVPPPPKAGPPAAA